MTEQSPKQSQSPVEFEQECCELYAEYCYPCRKPADKRHNKQQQTKQR